MKITNAVFDACLKCKYKAWNILNGEQGVPHAYEEIRAELQEEHKVLATTILLKRLKLSSASSFTRLSEPILSERHPLILDTVVEEGQLRVHCDALKLVDDKSALGNILYEPVLFHAFRKIQKDDKLCLALAGYVLSKVQGMHPPKGKIIFGENCSVTTVQLMNLNKTMLDVVHILLRMIRSESKPTLFLNQHCNICAFRDKCQEEAIETDTLSRLRGITEKEFERQNNRGIFTVEQYSYTYRPRKRRTNVQNQIRKHHLALNALAIRTDTIYIEQVPELPLAKNHIYLDIEGLPDRDFYYLLSAIVHQGGKQDSYTFWADNKSCEQDLWLSFTSLINSMDDFVIFHYGNYDIRGLIQMCRRYDGGQAFEELLLATAYNVLSAIYGHIYFPCYANDLKSVASCLGFRWHDPDSSGIKSIIERLSWERSACKKSRDWLIRYNKDDCEALRCVTNAIHALSQNRQTDDFHLSKTVVHTDAMKEPHAHELIDHHAFFPELEIINRRSYFDYQRNRVYVRTNHDYKRRVRQVLARKQSRRPVDKKITLETPTHCPYCKAMSFYCHSLLETVVEDLKFNSKGVKRWNIKYTTGSNIY
ncbi:TM0106 family RecB-like putative nuclease [Planctomycetota bacterium]